MRKKSKTFQAKFSSRCRECDEHILIGEKIKMWSSLAGHPKCANKAQKQGYWSQAVSPELREKLERIDTTDDIFDSVMVDNMIQTFSDEAVMRDRATFVSESDKLWEDCHNTPGTMLATVATLVILAAAGYYLHGG